MAATRSATNSSRPRIFNTISTEPASRRPAAGTKKSTAGRKTATGRVTKHKPTVKDKVKGAVEKAKGVVERKPGKKAAGTREMRGENGPGRKKKTAAAAPKKASATTKSGATAKKRGRKPKTEVDVKVKA